MRSEPMIEEVTVLPEGVTAIRIAGVELPVMLRAGQTIRYIKWTIDKRRFVVEGRDGSATTFMEWTEY